MYNKYQDAIKIAVLMIKANSWTLDEATKNCQAECYKRGLLVNPHGLRQDIINQVGKLDHAALRVVQ
jgi:hypothetical protein